MSARWVVVVDIVNERGQVTTGWPLHAMDPHRFRLVALWWAAVHNHYAKVGQAQGVLRSRSMRCRVVREDQVCAHVDMRTNNPVTPL